MVSSDVPTPVSHRPSPDELRDLVQREFRRRLGDTVIINDWRPADRGFSTESYLFTCVTDDGERDLVLRRPPELSLFPGYDLLRQVLVMDRLKNSGLPIPTVLWIDRESHALGTPYFVMDHIDSAGTASDFPSYHQAGMYLEATPEQRTAMWWGCVDSIAAVHRLDWTEMNLGFLGYPQHGDAPLEQVVNYLHDAIAWASGGSERPALERGLAYLEDHLYEPEHVVLCWGDSRLSNVLYGEDFDVRAVLDWEVAYLGDHEADLAWLLFLDWASSTHIGLRPLDGTPSRSEVVERYEKATGGRSRT